ncbi:hypothetical protein BGZ72_003978, partial [Mortierella alpina]
RWTYEVKTYETFEEIEEIEEVVEETEVESIIAREKAEIAIVPTTGVTSEVILKDAVTEDTTVVVEEKAPETAVEVTKEVTVKETVKEVVSTKETGVVAQPAVPEKVSWFRRALTGAEA